MALAAAPEIPGFRAPSPLGYGPTSTIYSAQSIALGRWVALTVYTTTLGDDRSQRRFRRGYEMARRLGTHPHAVTVLDFGLTADNRPYITSEMYEQGTLEGRIDARQQFSVSDTLRMGIALAGALETAHRAGVIHGGVHPARVLLSADGEPALADLGLVPLVDRAGLAALVGPMSYHSPPEVLEGEALTPATDVYSLASTLHTALTGQAPYAGTVGIEEDTTASLLLRILQHDIPPIGRHDVPPSLEHALSQALSCEPPRRFARPLALAQALQSCQQELGLRVTQPVALDVAAALSVAVDAGPPPDGLPPSVPPGTPSDPRVFVPYAAPDAPAAPLSLAPPPPPGPAPAPTAVPPPPPPPAAAEAPSAWPTVTEPPAMAVPTRDLPAPPESRHLESRHPETHHADGDAPAPAPDALASDRTRALPVIVLGLLVAVIFAGVTWSILSGDDAENQRAQPGITNDLPPGTNGRTAATRSGLTAVENATGVQLDWEGRSREPQVVVVLATNGPPLIIPADTGTALLIPSAHLDPTAGYCFAVVVAAEPWPPASELAADIPDEALGPEACVNSGSATTVLRG